MTSKFINLKPDSIEPRIDKNKLSLRGTILDSIASDTAVMVAARAIFESQRFDVVVPLERNIVRKGSDGLLAPLDSATINALCKDFNVDGILILEFFSEEVDREVNVKPSGARAVYSGIINVEYNTNWRLYQSGHNPPVTGYVFKNEIFWKTRGYYYSANEMNKKLPTIKEALIGGGIASSLELTDSICPRWIDQIRYYYVTGNKNIDAAVPLIKLNKWDEASEIWKKYSSDSSISLRSKIEFNLALAAEMKGDLDRAIEWGAKSLKTKYSRPAELYLKDLVVRRSELEKLKM